MDFSEYQERAARTANTSADVPPLVLNFALGLCGEAGEVAEMIKKAYYHGHLLDRHQMVYELGDVLWYLSALARKLGLDLQSIAEVNIAKLQARYPDGFDQARSREREQ